MEDKPVKPPRRRLPPMSMPVSDSVLSFFLDSPSSPHKGVSWEEPVPEDQRRTSVHSNTSLNAMQFPPLSRSRSDSDHLSAKSRLPPRSTSSISSSMSLKSSKKRPRSLANHLGGFVLHSVTPRESSILQYTSIVSPGTHTEYELVLEDSTVSSAGERWVVSRRYSGFRSLRDELARVFDRRSHPGAAVDSNNAHCSHCAPMVEALDKLSSKYFPKRRLWGLKSPKVVQQRADQFFKYLQGLLALATNPSTRRCPLVALGFAVQLRTFLTLDRGKPAGNGAVPFLLNEMTLMNARPDNATTLMTIDELDAVYADVTDDEVYELPSPVYVLENQDELRSWDELESWEESSVASSGWNGKQ